MEQLGRQRWPERDVFSIRLAVEEALVNAIKHGNQFDTSKRVYVTCSLSPARLRVEIADEGQGFDPNSLPDPTDPENLDMPCGRGIMLMRSFMSRVEFNETGNRVVLEKDRSEADA
jgi:serine/threonine-protein kinase RsbW